MQKSTVNIQSTIFKIQSHCLCNIDSINSYVIRRFCLIENRKVASYAFLVRIQMTFLKNSMIICFFWNKNKEKYR